MAARLMKELASLQRENDFSEIVLYPISDSNIHEWVGFIKGPPDTPYSQGTFELSIKVPVGGIQRGNAYRGVIDIEW